eukprot:137794-Chlamydomonas_euryale.AAC.1
MKEHARVTLGGVPIPTEPSTAPSAAAGTDAAAGGGDGDGSTLKHVSREIEEMPMTKSEAAAVARRGAAKPSAADASGGSEVAAPPDGPYARAWSEAKRQLLTGTLPLLL